MLLNYFYLSLLAQGVRVSIRWSFAPNHLMPERPHPFLHIIMEKEGYLQIESTPIDTRFVERATTENLKIAPYVLENYYNMAVTKFQLAH